jgi:ribulose-5-phosphate 4-epimerase/fuculose-1-phosphate aldolase
VTSEGPPVPAQQDADTAARQLRRKVALSCRIIGHRGSTRGTFGHVSARIPGTEHVLIKAKGAAEHAAEFATERDVIRIDLAGRVIDCPAGLAPPNEAEMHLAVYRRRPEVMSVIHAHSQWAVLLTAAEKPLVAMYAGYDGQAALRLLEEGVPTYPRTTTIVNAELAEEFADLMGDHRACLLRGHGMTVTGASVEEATETCLTLDHLAYLNYLSYALGGPIPIPDLEDHRQRWQDGASRPRRARDGLSKWRYQVQWLDGSSG